jgi:hypothetical protein
MFNFLAATAPVIEYATESIAPPQVAEVKVEICV